MLYSWKKRRYYVGDIELNRQVAEQIDQAAKANAPLKMRIKWWLFLTGMGLVALPLGWVLSDLVASAFGRVSMWKIMFGIFIYGGAIGALFALTFPLGARFIFRREMRRQMAKHGYPLCLGCGYQLTGLEQTTLACPECGEMIRESQPGSPQQKTHPTSR